MKQRDDGSSEWIVQDWSIAPQRMRKRALDLAGRQRVVILRFSSRGVANDGAWMVAIVATDGGTRVPMYAEDDAGRTVAEWNMTADGNNIVDPSDGA